jgi:hypothetical protein
VMRDRRLSGHAAAFPATDARGLEQPQDLLNLRSLSID